MANPARIHESRLYRGQESAREKRARARNASDTYRKAVEARSADERLWLQIARWVNEGGAGDDPSLPEKLRSFSQNIKTAP
jgi:hypothetical protein